LNFTNTKRTTELLYPDSADMRAKGKIDFILTPHFYTYIKEALGVKFAFQAKQFAPSLFDGLLQKEKNYSYHVIKTNEDEWQFYAYIPQEIEDFLHTKGIESSQIGKFYFAQEYPIVFEESIKIGSKEALKTLNGVVTAIPLRILPFDHKFGNPEDILNLELKNGLTLINTSEEEAFFSFKDSIILSSLFGILGIIFLIQAFMMSGTKELQASFDQLSTQYPNLSSEMVRNNIMQKYAKIDKEERFKRDTAQKISKLVSNDSNLSDLNLRENQIYGTFNAKNQMIENQIKNQASIEKLEFTPLSPLKVKVGGKL